MELPGPPTRPPLLPHIFPPFVATAEGPLGDLQAALHPEEAARISRAKQKRVQEFTAGRTCARAALAQMGYPDVALEVGEDRCPDWPAGIVGSISHSNDYCGVAVTRRKAARGLGIDIERAGAVTDRLQQAVLRDAEREWVGDTDSPSLWATLLFSAKEAIYKSWYPEFRQFLGFQDVEVSVDESYGRFRARILHDKSRGLEHVEGAFRFYDRWVFTGVVLPQQSAP